MMRAVRREQGRTVNNWKYMESDVNNMVILLTLFTLQARYIALWLARIL